MDYSVEYRERAKECRALANQATFNSHRLKMIEMAAIWDALAEEREAYLRLQLEKTAPARLPWREKSSMD